MVVFHADLDNTLIYSYKYDIGSEKQCVEIYQGREISFMTKQSFALLQGVNKKVIFVPTTTRTPEQYDRIDLGIGIPEYALVCNGGVLLRNGIEDEAWYQDSLKMTAECQEELEKAEKWLQTDPNRTFEIRNIRNLFVFTKSREPLITMEQLQQILNLSLVEVFCNGIKVYIVPKKLSKGEALQRFRQKITAEYVVAAGDSVFDITMLQKADYAIMPVQLAELYPDWQEKDIGKVCVCGNKNRIFSDEMLEHIIKKL